jgi:hypothetical protein
LVIGGGNDDISRDSFADSVDSYGRSDAVGDLYFFYLVAFVDLNSELLGERFKSGNNGTETSAWVPNALFKNAVR